MGGLLVLGSLIPMTHFPRLNEARHYNGIGIIDFMPFVFGGWNNGSTGTVEYLDERSDSPKWRWVNQAHMTLIQVFEFSLPTLSAFWSDLQY